MSNQDQPSHQSLLPLLSDDDDNNNNNNDLDGSDEQIATRDGGGWLDEVQAHSSPRRSNRHSVLNSTTKESQYAVEGHDDVVNAASDDDDEVVEMLADRELEEQEEETVGSIQIPEDEPSSALASRIIRAHDNPSPPPDGPSLSAGIRERHGLLEKEFESSGRLDIDEGNLIPSISRESTPTRHFDGLAQPHAAPIHSMYSDSFKDEHSFSSSRPAESFQPELEPCTSEPPALNPSAEQGVPAVTPPPQTPSPPQSDHRDHEPAPNPESTAVDIVPSSLPLGPSSPNVLGLETNGSGILPPFPIHPPQPRNDVSTPPNTSTNRTSTRALRRSPRRSVAQRAYSPFGATNTPSSANNEIGPSSIVSPHSRPNTIPANSSADAPSPSNEDVHLIKRVGETKGKRKASQQPPQMEPPLPEEASRELGSLSPDSNRMLSQLRFDPSFPSLSLALDAASKPPERNGTRIEDQLIPAPLFPHLYQGPQRVPMTPQRRGDTKRDTSPHRFQLASTGAEFAQTPARRIPIGQAVSQGYISPQKAALLNNVKAATPAGASRAPPLNILPSDSPARRIAVDLSSALQATKLDLRPKANTSSKSTRPQDVKRKPGISSTDTSNPRTPRPLPFPIISTATATGSKSAAIASSNVPASSPPKSTLKQPSSKIPRPVPKPYARPAGRARQRSDTITVSQQFATPGPSALASPIKQPITTIPTARGTTSKAGVTKKRSAASTTSNAPLKPTSSLSSPLKRKRDDPKPRTLQPVVMIDEKVVDNASLKRGSASQQPMPATLRLIFDAAPEKSSPMVVSPVDVPDTGHQTTKAFPPAASASKQPEAPLSNLVESQGSVSTHPSGSGSLRAETHQQEGPNARIRRTTRTRKPVQYFLPPELPNQPEPRASQSRRRAATSTSSIEVEGFAGMSAVALKNLTSDNTARNQVYLTVTLETEVIRKEGARPESPAVKIKTIAERQQEARGKMRSERAQRRAKRHAAASDGDGVYGEDSSESPPSSPTPGQHGESPEGVDTGEDSDCGNHPSKRTKDENDRRRVKWRPSLTKFVNLEEIRPGSRARSHENAIKKGCLAPKAKAAQLDTLGNLPDAKSPLRDLIQENITVKKYVYDDDVEPEEEVVVVKNTRSRARKNKS